MKAFFKRFALAVFVVFIVVYALAASYYLPRTALVHVTGTEIKRSDSKAKDGSTLTTDVRYVMTSRVDDGKAMVFKNEDTGWGWPPYFKFDSGDLAGEAMNLAKDKGKDKSIVLVTYYGWRTNLLSLFPNVVSLEEVGEGYEHIPIFNLAFLVFSVVFFIVLFVYARRLARWRPKKKGEGDSAPAEATEGNSD